jgi:ADP-ribose pyrophosphatase
MQKVIPTDAVLLPDNSVRVFEGMIYDVYQWPQALFDGSEHTFEMLKRPDTVQVIAIVDDKILLLDDEQPHLGNKKTFPGGRVDEADETILSAAQREVQEETGYSFNSWRLIKVWQPHTKIEWFVHLFLAWDVAGEQPTKHDAGEKISMQALNFDEVKAMVTGRIGHLGAAAPLFEKVEKLEDLQILPEFQGQTVDR